MHFPWILHSIWMLLGSSRPSSHWFRVIGLGILKHLFLYDLLYLLVVITLPREFLLDKVDILGIILPIVGDFFVCILDVAFKLLHHLCGCESEFS